MTAAGKVAGGGEEDGGSVGEFPVYECEGVGGGFVDFHEFDEHFADCFFLEAIDCAVTVFLGGRIRVHYYKGRGGH